MNVYASTDMYPHAAGYRIPPARWHRPLWSAVFVLAAVLVLLAVLPGFLRTAGFQVVAVSGSSMGRAVPDGSIVVTREVAGDSLRTGDIVVFRAGWPGGAAGLTSVVHRLSLIAFSPAGLVAYTTGDANEIADPMPLSLAGKLPQVKLVVPLAGAFYGQSSIWILVGAFGLLLTTSYRPPLTQSDATRSQDIGVRPSTSLRAG